MKIGKALKGKKGGGLSGILGGGKSGGISGLLGGGKSKQAGGGGGDKKAQVVQALLSILQGAK